MNSNDHALPTLDILRSRVRAGLTTYLQARANIIALSELDTLIALGWCDEQTATTIRLELASAAVAIPLPGVPPVRALPAAPGNAAPQLGLPAGKAEPVSPGKKRCPYPGCTTLIGSASSGCRKHAWKLRKAKSQTKALLAAKGRPPADLDLDDEDEIEEDRD